LFVAGDGLDVHQRARQFKNIHGRFKEFFLDGLRRGRTARRLGDRCLSIALHPHARFFYWHELRMTVDRPWTCPPTVPVSATGSVSAEICCASLSLGPPELSGTAALATHDFRTSTKNSSSLRNLPPQSKPALYPTQSRNLMWGSMFSWSQLRESGRQT
jgi:hypothetical protein